MTIDIADARKAKEELKTFLNTNNVLYHYIGINVEIAEYTISVGLDHTVDFSIVPEYCNGVKIRKELYNKMAVT